MFRYFSNGRCDVVKINRGDHTLDGPTTVEFQFSDKHAVLINAADMQLLRRAVYNERTPQDVEQLGQVKAENKFQFIKAIRSFYGLGLFEAKSIAEYFMDKFSLDCGK